METSVSPRDRLEIFMSIFISSADYSQAELIWYKFVRRRASVNFFKSLLLLHFLLDSFETRYTYFLGQSPNFVLFRFFMNFHQNSLKLLLLLHFSMDSFETRYTYFLGQSPNFVLFRILKFGFSDFFTNFHQTFIEIVTAPTISNGFLWNYVQLLSRSVFTSSFQFFEICFFFFNEFSSNFQWNRYCSYSFQWIPLKLGTLIL